MNVNENICSETVKIHVRGFSYKRSGFFTSKEPLVTRNILRYNQQGIFRILAGILLFATYQV